MTNAESFVGTIEQPPQPPIPGQPPMPPAPPQPDVNVFAQAVHLLRNDKMRSFRVDIETDSTIALDESESKQDAVQFTEAMGNMFQQVMPIVQQAPYMATLAGEMLLFVARRFKAGRTLEGTIEQAVAQGIEASKQPKGPSPEEQKVQGQLQLMQAKGQQEQQKTQAKLIEGQQKQKQSAQEHAEKMAQDRAIFEQEMEMREREFQQEQEQDSNRAALDLTVANAKGRQAIQLQQAKPANTRAA